jgi:hypothetical protein
MNLEELQSALKAHVFTRDEAIFPEVPGTPAFGTRIRLGVYVQAYYARLQGVLAKDYPALHGALGEEAEAVCDAYIAAHPSQSFTLRDFGQHLPAFLTRYRSTAARPWLAELAAFEWALVEAFDAPDAATVDEVGVAALPPQAWSTLRLGLHPAVRRLACRHNLPPLWHMLKDGHPLLLEPDPLPEAQHLVVWRDGYATRFRSLEPDEADAFAAIAQGGGFAEACTALMGWHCAEAIAPRAASLLKSWVVAGWFSELTW